MAGTEVDTDGVTYLQETAEVGPREPTPVSEMVSITRTSRDSVGASFLKDNVEEEAKDGAISLEPHERHCHIPIMQPGPPFKVADIVLCTPWNGHRQVALVTEASPPRYKLLLENGTRMDTAVDRVDIHPDWNHDHPEFAPRSPEPFVEERRLLLRQLTKRRLEETVDINRRAKRRRVAFADPPHQQQHQPFVLPPTETAQRVEPAVTLPPIDEWQDRSPPPEPPPADWTVELVPLLRLCEKGSADEIGN